jgi:hypothetical protein
MVWRSENLLILLGFISRTVQPIAKFDTLTTLFWLPVIHVDTFTNFSPPNIFEIMIETGQNEELVTAR